MCVLILDSEKKNQLYKKYSAYYKEIRILIYIYVYISYTYTHTHIYKHRKLINNSEPLTSIATLFFYFIFDR